MKRYRPLACSGNERLRGRAIDRYSFGDLRQPFMIAISGMWKQLPDRKVAEQMGFDAYLTKPCDTAVLLGLVNSFKRSRTPSQ